MMTFFAPPLVIWFSAPLTSLPFLLTPSFLIVNRPVPSITISTPRSFQGSLEGSVSLKALIVLPSMTRPSFPTSTLASKRP